MKTIHEMNEQRGHKRLRIVSNFYSELEAINDAHVHCKLHELCISELFYLSLFVKAQVVRGLFPVSIIYTRGIVPQSSFPPPCMPVTIIPGHGGESLLLMMV